MKENACENVTFSNFNLHKKTSSQFYFKDFVKFPELTLRTLLSRGFLSSRHVPVQSLRTKLAQHMKSFQS